MKIYHTSDESHLAYDQFVSQSPQGSIYCYSWWLDAVAPGQWRKVVVEENGVIQAALPFVFKKKWGVRSIGGGSLTPLLGVLLRQSNAKYSNSLSEQKELITKLISQLPSADSTSICCHYSLSNWLPFYWKGYQQTTSYSYLLTDIANHENLWAEMRENIRTDIKKGAKTLHFRDEGTIEEFLEIYKKSFSRQGMQIPIDEASILRLEKECVSRSCRKMYFACDSQQRVHAAVYVVWTPQSAYCVLAGGDPELRRSGAHSYVMWEAIKDISKFTSVFDFEGSMKESIERFYRAFGGRQTQTMTIFKDNPRARVFSQVSKIKRAIQEKASSL